MEDNFDIKELFGKNIKFLRKQLKLTQEQFAEKIGIDISTVSKMEKGIHFPTADNLNKIINRLGLEPSFLCIREKDYNIEQAYQEILASIEKLKTNKTLFKLAYDYITELEKELD